jgi:hypothetical protein
MGDGIDLAVVIAALPDNRFRMTARPDVGRLVKRVHQSEQVAAIGLGARD